jgi:aminoglycoside phosphotransferase family enzyme/predicted kinase
MYKVQQTDAQEQEPNRQNELISAMLKPGFYPNRPAEVTHKETHISHLFFAGDLVYKIKKAVRFSFLDYSTLVKRRYYIDEELSLNRRLAPTVYLGVVPIGRDVSGWRLGASENPLEFALLMRRLPDSRMLPVLLESAQVTPEMMRSLAQVLAGFHANAQQLYPAGAATHFDTVAKQWRDNLEDVEQLIGDDIDLESFAAIKAFGDNFLDQNREFISRRAFDGWVRDGHGDLHCEHVCFAPEGIQIFDCIEFDPQLRLCDLASEIGFLLMDLEARGGAPLGEALLIRYSDLINDSNLRVSLPFYKCYRALIRGKVEALRAGAGAAAARYFTIAGRQTWSPYKPFVVVVCGLTGSGKSTLARELSERIGIDVINSDVVRKELTGKSGRGAPFNQGIYSSEITEETYGKMFDETNRRLAHGQSAMLDATFAQRRYREKLLAIAARHHVKVSFLHCVASDGLTQTRLRERAMNENEVSDGRWEIYLEQKSIQEPLDECSQVCLELSADRSIEDLRRLSERFLRDRLSTSVGNSADPLQCSCSD